jgi:hypothetical protein
LLTFVNDSEKDGRELWYLIAQCRDSSDLSIEVTEILETSNKDSRMNEELFPVEIARLFWGNSIRNYIYVATGWAVLTIEVNRSALELEKEQRQSYLA